MSTWSVIEHRSSLPWQLRRLRQSSIVSTDPFTKLLSLFPLFFPAIAFLGRKADNLVPLLAEVQQKAKYALLKYVEKVTPDFLVCGSRGMGAVGRALLGSTSDFLAHNANCSVVIVKGDLPNKAKSREREVDVDVLEDEEDSREEARGGEAGEEKRQPGCC